MIHTIENDYLRVSVDDHGAELCSIFDKVHNSQRQRIYLRGYDC